MHRAPSAGGPAAEDTSSSLDAIAFDSSLSFIDDLHGVPKEIPAQFRGEPHVESDEQQDQPIEESQRGVPATEKPPSIPFRVRQKREIEYLRTQAAVLEAELQRHKQVPGNTESTSTQPSPWENIAKQQLNEKQRAEIENVKLRQQLESQLRVARSLEKLLQKRTASGPESLFFERKRARTSPEIELSDLVVGIRDNIGVRFDEIEPMMAMCQLLSINADFDDFRAAYDENGGVCMEMVIVKVYPFYVESVAEIFWQCTSGNGLKLHGGVYGALQHSDTLCELEFSVNLSLRRTQTVITCRGYGARRLKPNQSTMVFETVGMTEIPLLEDEHIVYRERGYITITATNSTPSNPSTIVRACARITPEFERSAREGRSLSAPKISWFTDLAIGSYEQTAKSLFQHIENNLMRSPSMAPAVETPSTTTTSDEEN